MRLFAGIIDPETLSAVEQNPQGELAKSAALCSALEIRYDLFLYNGCPDEDLPGLSSRVRNLFPKALQVGTIRLKRDGGMFPDAHAADRDRYFCAILGAKVRPDVVDIEIEELETLLPKVLSTLKRTGAKFLASHHDFLKVPSVAEFKDWIEQAKKEGIRPCIYTHPLGFHGHAAGPTIGLWDHQEGVEGSGDYPLHDNTAYSLELNATVYSKTYGCDIRMAMESDILLKDGKVYFLAGRQENFHVVK